MSTAWGPHAHPERGEEEWTRLRHENEWAVWMAIGAFALMMVIAVLVYEGMVQTGWRWRGLTCQRLGTCR